ncbi:sulfotransferase 2A6-like isoform X2 [Peromyscus maniculatus bairdii]|uniref:sulfotransferase 2A6-like isoform X2 n=1 Tax=Peromyscus maniculatus bairdii TaxID=230844 RepID=UPI003FD55DDE
MLAYFWFERIPFPDIVYKREIIEESHDKFVIRDEDTVIVSYPKSGTNWLIEIFCLIQTKENPEWNQSVLIWECSPWIETKEGLPILINTERPCLMSSHLPFHLFPKSFFRSKAKVIYVIRNPRDVLVSGYFFLCNTKIIDNSESLGTYIEWFLKGNVPYGSWFEHTRNWLSVREKDNFLLLSYEDMKKEEGVLCSEVLKVSAWSYGFTCPRVPCSLGISDVSLHCVLLLPLCSLVCPTNMI